MNIINIIFSGKVEENVGRNIILRELTTYKGVL